MANAAWEAKEEQHRFDDERDFEREAEQREDGPVERAGAALLVAFQAAFYCGVSALTDSVLRTIGNSYGSICFSYGPTPHPADIISLRTAMDAYVRVVPEATYLLFPDCPFGEVPAAKTETSRNPAFRALMEKIRGEYWRRLQRMHDGAALDSLAEERGIYDPARFPLQHVVNALVRVSPKAQELNRKYFGGRFA